MERTKAGSVAASNAGRVRRSRWIDFSPNEGMRWPSCSTLRLHSSMMGCVFDTEGEQRRKKSRQYTHFRRLC